ncbi:MAG: A24 family peptidase [Capsulimonas sp.]|uniref:A24 family peptidase n=1 Tax=Capsulimonas sp. TaxID=2494211 RepID=UPI0032643E57
MLIPVLLTIVLLIAVFTDIRTQKIYNWLTFPAIGLGIVINICLHGWHGLTFALCGMGIACLSLFITGGMKFGDMKLFIAVGSMMGPGFMLIALLCTFVVSGVLGILYAWKKGVLRHTVKNTLTGLQLLLTLKSLNSLKAMASESKAGYMAYAPSIALGVAVAAYLLKTGALVKPF